MSGRLKISLTAGLTLTLAMLTACSNTPNSSAIDIDPDPRDPYQNINRKVYAFNDVVDKNLLVPLVNVYENVTPNVVEKGVSNFFSNLSDMDNLLNHSLQLKPKKAAKDLGRLVINTTLGLGGLIDVASNLGIYQESEDFGQTLGYWGVNSGPYIVLPLLGPSTLRDASALVIDMNLSPIDRYDPVADDFYISALQVVDIRHRLGDFESLISGDPYIFMREAYLQRREHLIKDGAPGDDDDFDDF
jgi:phospholipid-binding lipoprotein MlaA